MIREQCGLELEAQQILNEITLFRCSESQVHASVVVIDHSVQIGKATIVIETIFEVGGDSSNGGGSIAQIRTTIRLEAVNADFARLMQIPARFCPERLGMAVVASSFTAEQRISTCGSCLIDRHR